jgi:hypothetical protein
MQLKVRYLPYFNDAVMVDDYIKNAERFFENLPDVCPFCGWIGNDPLNHGYNPGDWYCPILVLAQHIRQFRGARRFTDEDILEK